MRLRPLALLVVAVALWVPATVAISQAPAGGLYRLGPRDLLRVRVFEVPELNVESRVSETGTVNLPLIGDVSAEGLTEPEFAAKLKELLESRYVNRASVSVQILEARSRPIILLGAVKTPGNLADPGRWTLLDAITAAGGVTENHGDLIYILRRAENGLTDQLTIEVDDLLVRGRPEANVPIRAADVINIPTRVDISIYCLGEVRSPGEIRFKSTDRVTLLAVIGRAGGLTDRASKKIRIRRAAAGGLGTEEVVSYRRVLAGKEVDPRIEEGDVIVVKESLF